MVTIEREQKLTIKIWRFIFWYLDFYTFNSHCVVWNSLQLLAIFAECSDPRPKTYLHNGFTIDGENGRNCMIYEFMARLFRRSINIQPNDRPPAQPILFVKVHSPGQRDNRGCPINHLIWQTISFQFRPTFFLVFQIIVFWWHPQTFIGWNNLF